MTNIAIEKVHDGAHNMNMSKAETMHRQFTCKCLRCGASMSCMLKLACLLHFEILSVCKHEQTMNFVQCSAFRDHISQMEFLLCERANPGDLENIFRRVVSALSLNYEQKMHDDNACQIIIDLYLRT